MSPKGLTLRPGDVFEIPLADGRLGYGVIIHGGGVPYVIILRSVHHRRPELSVLVDDQIALVGQTMDALIYHDRWTIAFHGYPARSDIPFPIWKVGIGGQLMTTDFTGQQVLGPSSKKESELLDYKFSRSPIAYQDALEAMHGLREWRPDYDKLTPAYAFQRVSRC